MRILLNRPVSIQGVDYSVNADVSSVCLGTIQSLLAVGWARKEEDLIPGPLDFRVYIDTATLNQDKIVQEQKADAEQATIESDPVEVVQEQTSIDTLDLPEKIKVSLKRQGLGTVEKLIEYHDKYKSFEPLREIGRNISRQIAKQIGR